MTIVLSNNSLVIYSEDGSGTDNINNQIFVSAVDNK